MSWCCAINSSWCSFSSHSHYSGTYLVSIIVICTQHFMYLQDQVSLKTCLCVRTFIHFVFKNLHLCTVAAVQPGLKSSPLQYLCKYDLRVCDDGKLVHILYSWTLSIVLSLSKMLTKYKVSEIGFYLRNVIFCQHFRQGQDDGQCPGIQYMYLCKCWKPNKSDGSRDHICDISKRFHLSWQSCLLVCRYTGFRQQPSFG
jgi:hypothetical protein